MKFKQYRQMDLCLLAIIAIIAEVLGLWLHKELPLAGYYISFSTLIAIIALLRWGVYGTVVNCVIALPAVLFSESPSIALFLFYILSGSAAVLVPVLFRKLETSIVVSRSYWLLLYVTAFYGVLILARGICGFILGLPFLYTVVQTVSQHLLSMVMSYSILIIIKNREGLLVNMRTYFLSMQEESGE